jgi:hypothetical protein
MYLGRSFLCLFYVVVNIVKTYKAEAMEFVDAIAGTILPERSLH